MLPATSTDFVPKKCNCPHSMASIFSQALSFSMGIVPDWSRTTLLVPAFLFWCPDGLSVIANTAFVKAKLDQMFQRRLEKTCGN